MAKRHALVALALAISITPTMAEDMPSLPDSQKTPGAVLELVPDAKTATCLKDLIGGSVKPGDTITLAMICTDGYTKCIRDVSDETKKKVYESYGLAGEHTGYCKSKQGCEVDHLISLEIGGSNDEKNLWPEPYEGEVLNAHVKDQLEKWLHNAACTGQMSLKDAQKEISTNWVDAFRKHIGEPH